MRRSIIFAALATIVFIPACGKAPEPPKQPPASPAEVAKHMDEHFGKVREVQDALIRGDLEEARAPATWLADHVETTGLPGGTETRVTEMQASAKSVAAAQSVGNAAIAVASMVEACGHCHATAKVAPAFAKLPAESPTEKVPPYMQEHQRAFELMYRGLVSPTSGDWVRGAEELKTAPLVGKEFKNAPGEALAAETRVHELASRAIDAPDMRTRVTIYGALIGGCADCHAIHGKLFGSGLPKSN